MAGGQKGGVRVHLFDVDVSGVEQDVVLATKAGEDGGNARHQLGERRPPLGIGVPALDHHRVAEGRRGKSCLLNPALAKRAAHKPFVFLEKPSFHLPFQQQNLFYPLGGDSAEKQLQLISSLSSPQSQSNIPPTRPHNR